jgi:secondary thiamine-phosphate synthase enzyme
VIYENADPTARADLHRFFEDLVPEDHSNLIHTMEGPDDSTSHLRMALTRTSENIPIAEGSLQLGTWQGIYLFEHRKAPHRRTVVVSLMGVN